MTHQDETRVTQGGEDAVILESARAFLKADLPERPPISDDEVRWWLKAGSASATAFKAAFAAAMRSPSAALPEGVEGLVAALERVERWFGEFPETGEFWDREKKQPLSYGAQFGSNGERDFMRAIARDALTAFRRTSPASTDVADGAWQPIETAPAGVDVLLYCPEQGITNHERIELGMADNGRGSHHGWATMWKPLPSLPTKADPHA